MQQPCAATSLLHCLLPSFKEQLASTIHPPRDHHHKLRQVTTSVTSYAMLWYGDEDGRVINNTTHEGGGGGGQASRKRENDEGEKAMAELTPEEWEVQPFGQRLQLVTKLEGDRIGFCGGLQLEMRGKIRFLSLIF
ncbi:TonB-dependent receptor [Sesbania bispinosa]|nr:TonB-dependent receptor [Sesbania bispinosa]